MFLILHFIFSTTAVLYECITHHRTVVVDCMTEIGSLPPSDMPERYHHAMRQVLVMFVQQLATFVPPTTDFKAVNEAGSEDDCIFIHRLAIFFTTYFKSYLPLFHSLDGNFHDADYVLTALRYMINISEVEDEEVFRTCLDLWLYFTKETYSTIAALSVAQMPLAEMSMLPKMTMGAMGSAAMSARLYVVKPVLQALEKVMLEHFAKPEEVIVVVDDDGEIIREQTKDTEVRILPHHLIH